MTKTKAAIRSLDPHAAESFIYFLMQALADYVCATNLPSMTANLRMDMDDQLRRLYNDVFDVDLLDPAGQEDHRIEDPEFVHDLFCLKLNQAGGGFGPTVRLLVQLSQRHEQRDAPYAQLDLLEDEESHSRLLRLPQRVDWRQA